MKRLLLLAIALFSVSAYGQTVEVSKIKETDSLNSSQVQKRIENNVADSLEAHAMAVYSQRVLFGSGAPTGTCPTGKIYERTSNGFIYGCANGTWTLVASGSGISGLTTNAIPLAASSTTLSDSVITQASSMVGVGLGTVAPPTALTVGDTSSSSPRGIMSWEAETGTNGARLGLRKNRGTFAAPTTIVTGDTIGRIVAWPYDGTSWLEMGSIEFVSTGTIATNRTPTQIVFKTATDAAPSVLTTALTIGSDQTVTFAKLATIGVGNTSSAQTDFLINPTTKASGNLLDLQVNSVSKLAVDSGGNLTTAAGFIKSARQLEAAGANGLGFTNRAYFTSGADSALIASNNGITGLSSFAFGATTPSTIGTAPTHGQTLSILQAEELLTIAAAATTTTTMQIPANAVVMAVSVRVTTVIPTAATFTVKVGSTTVSTTNVSTAANTTNPGTAAGSFYNSTAQGVTITPDLTPGAATGVVRVTVAYYLVTPPTS